jgi:hypothetical protein
LKIIVVKSITKQIVSTLHASIGFLSRRALHVDDDEYITIMKIITNNSGRARCFWIRINHVRVWQFDEKIGDSHAMVTQ